MLKIRLSVLALASVVVVSNSFAQYASSVVAYTPGTGYSAGLTDPTSALGEPSRVTPGMYGGPVDPFDPAYLASQLVSIGAGGSLTLQFNTPIQRNPGHPYGTDFILFGNSFFVITNGDYSGGGITDGTFFGNAPGSTRVSVSADGVTFYTLDPARAPVVSGLFPTDGSGNFQVPVNPALASADFAGQDLAGIRALYAGSGGGTGYELAWAEDGSGQSVSLDSVNFVRVDVLSGKLAIDGIVAVPEPCFLGLGALGAAVLVWSRQRKG